LTELDTAVFFLRIQWIRLDTVSFRLALVYYDLVTRWSPEGMDKILKTKRQSIRISKTTVDAAKPEAIRYALWDVALPGFGLTVSHNGLKTFVLRYRAKHKFAPKRFVKLGQFGPISAEEARRMATEILGQVASGKDPALEQSDANNAAITFGDACDRFLEIHVKGKRKAGTYALYAHIIEKKLKPAFGNRHILKITKLDVANFHDSLKTTQPTANRCITTLASIYSWAGRTGLIDEGINPARRIEKYKEVAKDRYLSMSEITRLGQALREAETEGFPYAFDPDKPTSKHGAKPGERNVFFSPFAVAAIRLLIFTGCRKGEILKLKWSEVDFERGMLHLPDSKTGRKVVLLGQAAIKVLQGLPRVGDYVIAGADPDKPRVDLKRPWDAIREKAELEGVRLHDLRHSFASVGAGAGLGLPIIGKLLGHSQSRTTERYAHLADDPLRRASEMISHEISQALG
jgi:integrase